MMEKHRVAATKIAAVMRGFRVRNGGAVALRFLQSRFRGVLVQRRYRQLKGAQHQIRCFSEARRQRLLYVTMRQKASLLTALFRGKRDRVFASKIKFATRLVNEQKRLRESREAEILALTEKKDSYFDLLDVDLMSLEGADACWTRSATDVFDDVTKKGARVSSLALGRAHSVILTDTGQVYGLGKNFSEEIVFSSFSRVSCIVAVACGSDFSLALSARGELFSWGDNRRGQLGQGHVGGKLFKRPKIVNIGGRSLFDSMRSGARSLHRIKHRIRMGSPRMRRLEE